MYARAREQQGHVAAERAVREACQATPETAHSARVKMDALRWFAAKLLPRVYGDRIEHAGSINVNVGLADRLNAARKRLATAGAVIEGVALPSPQPTTLPAVATDEAELVE
jgi:hypothetical protein